MSGIVVIGASAGGLHALEAILDPLPADYSKPILVVQHRSDDGSALLSGLLARHTRLVVSEADDKSALRPGCVLVAPAGYHALVEDGHVSLSTDGEVRFSRPSIDVSFETAAEAYGERAVGVVLTGANDDGSRGLAAIRRAGGTAIVQEPASAEHTAMPAAAVAAADPQWVLPLEAIAERLVALEVLR